MKEERFVVAVAGGALSGHRGGDGPPALLLHGGPAFPDYTEACAAELAGVFETIRYTQRGVPPSEAGPPYTIESHVADAVAVLDFFGLDRAWAIGHSWGGHLALHLAVAHPKRLLGIVCIDPLGAFGDIFEDFGRNLRRAVSPEQVARVEEVEARRRAGTATEADLLERSAIVWPAYFAHPESAPPHPVEHIGVQCSADTNASIAAHFERGTLVERLPGVSLPAFFVHGADDALPPRSSTETAALIPGARVELIEDCGHFPWLECPGELLRAYQLFQ
ncbi:MAG: alpha/beta fold hydrolase [Gaiellaceae bacterium]